MMKSAEKGPINLGNPNNEITIKNLVNVFEKITNSKLNIKYLNETENDPKQRRPDISKAIDKLNFEIRIDIIEGLNKTLDYFYNLHNENNNNLTL